MSRARDIADFVAEITDGTDTVETGYVVNGSAKAYSSFESASTFAVRQSFNSSSITDNGAGNYTINFTSSMANDDYAPTGMAGGFRPTLFSRCLMPDGYTAGSFSFRGHWQPSGDAYYDSDNQHIIIFGDLA